MNLVENAVRYAPHGSTMTVNAYRSGNATELRVTDHGPGIPAALKELVFDAFVQGAEEITSRSSRGLGLCFCKAAVEAHGGSIRVGDAAPGTVFCITIPD